MVLRKLGVGAVEEELAGRAPPPARQHVEHAYLALGSRVAGRAEVQDTDDPPGVPRHERAICRVRKVLPPDTRPPADAIRLRWRIAAIRGLGGRRVHAGGLFRVCLHGTIDLDRATGWADPGPVGLAPGADGHGCGLPLDGTTTPRCREGGLPPGWRHEAGGDVGEWREDEQSLAHRRMRHLQKARGGPGIDLGRERCALGRSLDGEAVAAEEQEIEVQLARAPAPALTATELAFEPLERDEQVRGPRSRVGAGWDVEHDDRVQEVGLVGDADRLRSIQARDASEASARQVAQGVYRLGERRACVADVRTEPDIRPNRAAHCHLDRLRHAPGYSRRVRTVAVRILHLEAGEHAGELTRLLATARSIAADELARQFEAGGANDVLIVRGAVDGRSFGERLRGMAAEVGAGRGLIVLGSGSIPLATGEDVAMLVDAARSGEAQAMTNNRYSSDVVSIGDASILGRVPDLSGDNGLPRWLESIASVQVRELPNRARLGLDIDSPLDLELLRRHPACPAALSKLARSMAHRLERVAQAFDELAGIAQDSRRELLVAGRLSAAALRELEEGTACRVRALIEERGLRTSVAGQRPPASALGMLLDRAGPGEIGMLVARLADGAVIDTRVLLAHRHGADEAAWPSPEDRFASDLLLADRVRDPWLQQLTLDAWSHSVPIALGGHTLVGPGLGLALGITA
jgi:hypothetical protein